MPRPTRARDLIELEPGAPEFRVGSWWQPYSEGKLFYPRGFAEAMPKVELESVVDLVDYLPLALKEIAEATTWGKQLKDTKNWPQCSPGKLKLAASEEPMILTKAVQCMVALELYVRDKVPPEKQIDVYEQVKLFPGQTAVSGLNPKIVEELITKRDRAWLNFERDARDLTGQERQREILKDVAEKKFHVPWGIAQLIHRHFDNVQGMDIQIRQAERFKARGISPASPNVKPYYEAVPPVIPAAVAAEPVGGGDADK